MSLELTPAQQLLVESALPLVRKIAGRQAKQLPPWVDMDEIVAAGYLGLCQAALRFDPERHASFEVWAVIRIRGAMVDEFKDGRYPRRYQEMPASWLNGDCETARELENAPSDARIDGRKPALGSRYLVRLRSGVQETGTSNRVSGAYLRAPSGGTQKMTKGLPESLVTRDRTLETLINAEQCAVVAHQAAEACRDLRRLEKNVLAEHLAGQSLRQIGLNRRQPKSPVWAHYTLRRAKGQVRKRLEELFGDEFRAPDAPPKEAA